MAHSSPILFASAWGTLVSPHPRSALGMPSWKGPSPPTRTQIPHGRTRRLSQPHHSQGPLPPPSRAHVSLSTHGLSHTSRPWTSSSPPAMSRVLYWFIWPQTNGPPHKSISTSHCIFKLTSQPELQLFYCCCPSQTCKNSICPSLVPPPSTPRAGSLSSMHQRPSPACPWNGLRGLPAKARAVGSHLAPSAGVAQLSP